MSKITNLTHQIKYERNTEGKVNWREGFSMVGMDVTMMDVDIAYARLCENANVLSGTAKYGQLIGLATLYTHAREEFETMSQTSTSKDL